MPSWEVHFNLRLQTNHPQIVADLARVHALARVIREIPIPPAAQRRIDRLNILRAVRGTTGIEGTELSHEEVSQVVDALPGANPLGPGREREERETRNAEALMRHVGQLLAANPALPVTEELIQDFHRILTEGIAYPNNVPGRYRSHPVNVGPYRPPETEDAVRRLMAEFVRWLNAGPAAAWDAVLRAIAAHFYLVSIHPFGDGNGRTSRAVESFLLYKAGINVRGYYSLANYYYENRAEYINQLNSVQLRGGQDLTSLAAFALRGLVQELEGVHSEVLAAVRAIAFRDYAREFLSESGRLATPARERQWRFLNELSNAPVSLTELRSGGHPLARLYRRVSSRTLTRDLTYLQASGLIAIAGDTIRARVDRLTSAPD